MSLARVLRLIDIDNIRVYFAMSVFLRDVLLTLSILNISFQPSSLDGGVGQI